MVDDDVPSSETEEVLKESVVNKPNEKEEKGAASEDENEGDESSQESEEEREYEIEKIVGHKLVKGKVTKYEIKWKGYSKEDNTMESADSIHDDAPEICEKYWDSFDIQRPKNAPGYIQDAKKSDTKPKKNTNQKKETRETKSKRAAEEIDSILEHVPRCMTEKGYIVPKTYPNDTTDWDAELKTIAAVQLSPVDKNVMLAYVEWLNGQKTIHRMAEVHTKSPENLVDYYEARLRFV
ncbi:hypothetical protein BY458DRAFT_434541 [Sporodiniella umbellata]|nr:hypothetical protein BY458DRAFT_434541 [Sporodiniella umbellata]